MTRAIALLLLVLVHVHAQDRMLLQHCASFLKNYEVYCRGIWTPEKLLRLSHHLEKIERFCPNYKNACLHHDHEDEERRKKKLRKRHRKKLEKYLKTEMTYEDIQQRLSELVPCTPECNVTQHPHCTQDCKCDYDWETFQKFCFEPTLKEFEATCSDWFARCPQYEQYAEEDGPPPEREIVYHPPLDKERRIIYNMG